MLYFSEATALQRAAYEFGTGPTFLDDVNCDGSELLLLNCSNVGVGNHNCNNSKDAGVRCQSNNGR